MPTLTINLRAALRDRFRDAFGERLHRLILYGSYARGDATPQSDIDVLVVLTGDTTSCAVFVSDGVVSPINTTSTSTSL